MQLNKKPESFMTGNGMKCILITFLSEDYFLFLSIILQHRSNTINTS